jgi:hypothetical protein
MVPVRLLSLGKGAGQEALTYAKIFLTISRSNTSKSDQRPKKVILDTQLSACMPIVTNLYDQLDSDASNAVN